MKFECPVCWYAYDPAEGDPVWQVEAGTPFEGLPDHWSCPHCATEKARFLPMRDEAA